MKAWLRNLSCMCRFDDTVTSDPATATVVDDTAEVIDGEGGNDRSDNPVQSSVAMTGVSVVRLVSFGVLLATTTGLVWSVNCRQRNARIGSVLHARTDPSSVDPSTTEAKSVWKSINQTDIAETTRQMKRSRVIDDTVSLLGKKGGGGTTETEEPTPVPTEEPTIWSAIEEATNEPTIWEDGSDPILEDPEYTYRPGKLRISENGLLLSKGLKSRILAKSGELVQYPQGGKSRESCHVLPDFGATYNDTRPGNEGGWIYVSNSEAQKRGKGGVGAFTFDKNGRLIDYRMVLTDTTGNCGGGRTPWGAWISCEEVWNGRIYQVDPQGEREPQVITLGEETDGGYFESFAYDVRDRNLPRFFVTEDVQGGPLRRFTPRKPDWEDPWSMLLGKGQIDYLLLFPKSGTFSWTTNYERAQLNAESNYHYAEGIDCVHGRLYFVSKFKKTMFILDLDRGTYQSESTSNGAFEGQPDQIAHVLQGQGSSSDTAMIFFTEDGGLLPGIHMRDGEGTFRTLLESPEYVHDETTGIAFSPDYKFLYFSIQNVGLIYEVWRKDGFPFDAETLNIKYHDIGFEAQHAFLEFP